MKPQFVEIILPLALEGTFTYKLSPEQQNMAKIGQRVAVPFATNKRYTGIIHSMHNEEPLQFKAKMVDAILETEPLVTQKQITFWGWIADYYLCTIGEVYRMAVPNALKLESETFVKKYIGAIAPNDLGEDESILWVQLDKKHLISVKEASEVLKKSAIPAIKKLMELGLVVLDEKLQPKYTAKTNPFVAIPDALLADEQSMHQVLDDLNRAAKQRELFLQLYTLQQQENKPIRVKTLLEKIGISRPVLKALEEKNYVQISEKQISRLKDEWNNEVKEITLSAAQEEAWNHIQQHWKTQDYVLLQGVAASGKTEIYIKAIKKTLSEGKKVLFLTPEIGLNTQLYERLKLHFENQIGVYHSKFNANERVELWVNTIKGKYPLVMGAHAALMLPIQDLGLIVVDECHDSGYKITHQKPHLNLRDAALVWAKMQGAKVLMGSATPTIETRYKVEQGKYAMVQINERYGDSTAAPIEIIDLKKAMKKREMKGNISLKLEEQIRETLQEKRQVIIFQNRRGYAPILSCDQCGYTQYCPNCDVSLTFHKFKHQLKCHYCGHIQGKPQHCPSCHSNKLNTKGIGTEQISDELEILFPDARIARMDVDSMRRKNAYEKLLDEFKNQEIDILVGTQMVTKGLDFDFVNLVAVIRGDSLLNYPDYKAHEQGFQVLMQLAGRAGRRAEQGKMLIQAFEPEHSIFQSVSRYDYEGFYESLLKERRMFRYPPFVRIIRISFRHAKQERMEKMAQTYTVELKKLWPEELILGPEAPGVARIKGQYISHLQVKILTHHSRKKIKGILLNTLHRMNTIAAYRSVKVDFLVDY